MRERIEELAKKYLPLTQENRRHIHAHPELGKAEFETQKYIMQQLDDIGIPYKVLAETGVVAVLEGKQPGKTVLLRADIDALPIQESADVEYASTVDGVMHACGHDGHTAGLLGACRILWELRDEITGNIKFMFQPAEETVGGAEQMIQEGILENPKVDAAFGLHLAGNIPQGHFDVRYGAMCGAPDEFTIMIHGRGGHAASPEQTIDPISIAVQFISNAQHILTRRLDPVKPALISFTCIKAGEGHNVIPETCEIRGTIRTLYPDSREQVTTYLEETLASLCTLHGATYEYNFMPSYIPLINDDKMTRFVENCLIENFGEERVHEIPFPSLGAEDFAYLAAAVPSSFYHVGIRQEGKEEPIFHHPSFAWNDEVLEATSTSLALIAYKFLNE